MKDPTRSSRQTGAMTIADVAKHAGVSTMTVSRVINGEPNVRASTRERIKSVIAELNYAPNSAARTLAGASQVRLGLLYSNPSAAYLSEFLVGSLDQASRSDIQLVIEKCEIGQHEIKVVERLVRSGIDGIILPPPLCDSKTLLDYLLAEKVPTVVVATGCPPEEAAAVSIDDFGAAAEMTCHLISLGHARIGFITGNPNLTASDERLRGYRSALEEAAIQVDPSLIVEGLFTYRSGLDAAEVLLGRDDPPTAIFASNDDMAAAVVAVAHRRSLDVPGDLTVVGFDDTALATTIWPELTTIHQPVADMSRAAVELLVKILKKRRQTGDTAPHVQLGYTLVRRQSDAAPRQRPPAR